MSYLLAIDPGAALGWALFKDSTLCACGLSKTKGTRLTVAQRVAQHVANLRMYLAGGLMAADTLVVERGTWRGGGKGSMTAAQLADYNCIVGQLAGHHGVLLAPDEWKGRVPKEVHQPKILAAMSAQERAVLAAAKVAASLENNVVDAIGLGLFQLNRLGRLQVSVARDPSKPATKRARKAATKRATKLRAPKHHFKMSEAA